MIERLTTNKETPVSNSFFVFLGPSIRRIFTSRMHSIDTKNRAVSMYLK
jgi:hypothetical protein